jgi:peptide/nickel transport system ATP-binding protein
MRSKAVLSIQNLSIALPSGADRAHAVENVSFDVNAGEIVCLLGESGSGKSVIAFSVMGLLPDNVRVSEGKIELVDTDLLTLSAAQLREKRGDDIAMIFQEPMTALNPVMSCGDQLDELLEEHTSLSASERRAKTLAMFDAVKLPEPERMYASYPHQLSGRRKPKCSHSSKRCNASAARLCFSSRTTWAWLLKLPIALSCCSKANSLKRATRRRCLPRRAKVIRRC